jgi:hypothetical protein
MRKHRLKHYDTVCGRMEAGTRDSVIYTYDRLKLVAFQCAGDVHCRLNCPLARAGVDVDDAEWEHLIDSMGGEFLHFVWALVEMFEYLSILGWLEIFGSCQIWEEGA